MPLPRTVWVLQTKIPITDYLDAYLAQRHNLRVISYREELEASLKALNAAAEQPPMAILTDMSSGAYVPWLQKQTCFHGFRILVTKEAEYSRRTLQPYPGARRGIVAVTTPLDRVPKVLRHVLTWKGWK